MSVRGVRGVCECTLLCCGVRGVCAVLRWSARGVRGAALECPWCCAGLRVVARCCAVECTGVRGCVWLHVGALVCV